MSYMNQPKIVLIEAFADGKKASRPVSAEEVKSFMPKGLLRFQACQVFGDPYAQKFGFPEGATQTKIMVPANKLMSMDDALLYYDRRGNFDVIADLYEAPKDSSIAIYGTELRIIPHKFSMLACISPNEA